MQVYNIEAIKQRLYHNFIHTPNMKVNLSVGYYYTLHVNIRFNGSRTSHGIPERVYL